MDQKGFLPIMSTYRKKGCCSCKRQPGYNRVGFFFFAFNLPIINNQCDLQNNLQKMIGFIIAINYLVRCHQHWDQTIPLTPPARGVSFCIGNEGRTCSSSGWAGSDLSPPETSWQPWVHHPHPPQRPAVTQACRVQGSGEGSFPGLSCKPKVRCAGFWHRQARGTGAGGSRAGWADPRLGQTQGAWVR